MTDSNQETTSFRPTALTRFPKGKLSILPGNLRDQANHCLVLPRDFASEKLSDVESGDLIALSVKPVLLSSGPYPQRDGDTYYILVPKTMVSFNRQLTSGPVLADFGFIRGLDQDERPFRLRIVAQERPRQFDEQAVRQQVIETLTAAGIEPTEEQIANAVTTFKAKQPEAVMTPQGHAHSTAQSPNNKADGLDFGLEG